MIVSSAFTKSDNSMPCIVFLVLLILMNLAGGTKQAFALWVNIPSSTVTLPDSRMSPYLCASGGFGLWFITSSATGYGSHNGVFRLTLGDTVATLVDEFPANSNIVELTGIALFNRDVFVSAKTRDGGAYIVRYRNGLKDGREFFPKNGQTGYETAFYGIDITVEGHLFAGVPGTGGDGLREFDFAFGGTAGAEILPRPGGVSVSGRVRDISLVPGKDYNLPGNYVLYSRAGSGVCRWSGGRAGDPSGYRPEQDLVSTGPFSPYGIMLDYAGSFYLCSSGGGNVSVRLLNAFGFLLEILPDPGFESPSDVAMAGSGDYLFVVDQRARKIFLFESPIAVRPTTWGILKALFK